MAAAAGFVCVPVALEWPLHFQSHVPMCRFCLSLLTLALLAGTACAQTFNDFLRATNRAWLPEASFHTLQATPDGRPAFIAFDGPRTGPSRLLYWERAANGQWRQEVVVATDGPVRASLFLDPNGQPMVMVGDEIHTRGQGAWQFLQYYADDLWRTEALAAQGDGGFQRLSVTADTTPDALQFATLYPFTDPAYDELSLSINAAGLSAFDSSAQPRFFSAVCDDRQALHAVFVPEFYSAPLTDGAIVRSELWYLTNRRGYWETKRIYAPPVGGYGDAGLGACIALRPDGQPAVASLYVSRAATGSATAARLLLHELGSNDLWTTTPVATASDGYRAGDGEIGTGYAPHLRFDGQGRPHIVFTDFATQHFDGFGQDEFGGNLRHAWRDGAQWRFTTVLRQNDPLRNQLLWPNLAFLSGGRLAVLGQLRRDVLGNDLTIQTNLHSLAFVEFTPAGYTVTCNYTLSAARTNHSSGGESGVLTLTTGDGCGWQAVSSAEWLHSASAGVGSGTVFYYLDDNPTAQFRTATLTVGGQTFTVQQGAAGWVWDDLFGWLYYAGNDWYGGGAYGWMWFSGREWIWSGSLHGWLAYMGGSSRTLWSTQFRWFTPSATDRFLASTSTLGPVYVGQYRGANIPAGWVVSERFGYVWANGDGVWFFSNTHGWLGVTANGGIWSVDLGRFL